MFPGLNFSYWASYCYARVYGHTLTAQGTLVSVVECWATLFQNFGGGRGKSLQPQKRILFRGV